ncbi:crotonase/enoyl-CoA hydratase family protein [Pseudomarimonas arenosa]|uniref:Crotonase/enoyl-CoA hydratase family protein n=1 Tax=Pseudomarimonas arenosa TaxID=2774145 RepID=A0AAW3ZVE3_9GAMM|nr:crotonase/enoyl-CoA hydratase family protein [Pseudomarimonas arenosa]MBD8528262.1 crotonase/enoyl-CoA hydratase family protein [Pseudomarimonas arenosa]
MALLRQIRHNDIVELQLARADKRNAMSFAMMRELLAAGRDLRRDRTLRAVILSGQGESFCAGIDLADLADRRNRLFGVWELIRPGQSLFQQACLIWRRLPVPVIAALHGHCFGAGMQLALGADIRIAHPATQLSIMEGRWGLVPDMGLSESLRGLLSADVAKDLCFSARIIDGEQARSLGLVTQVADDPLAAAQQLTAEYAQRSPDAIHAAKQVVQAISERSPNRSLALEKRWQLKLMLGRNFAIARQRAKQPETPFLPRQY